MKDKLGSLFMSIWLCLEIFVGYLLVYSSDYDDGYVKNPTTMGLWGSNRDGSLSVWRLPSGYD